MNVIVNALFYLMAAMAMIAWVIVKSVFSIVFTLIGSGRSETPRGPKGRVEKMQAWGKARKPWDDPTFVPRRKRK